MATELGSNYPIAPDVLARAVLHEKDKYFDYKTAFEQTVSVLSPILEALSEPERISRSTTLIDGVPQEDLWRKELQFPPFFVVYNQPFPLGVRQIVHRDGTTKAVVFETSVEHDSVFLGGMYFDPSERYAPYTVIAGSGRAKSGEAKELVELANFVAHEAPVQAKEKGFISKSWIKRRLTENLSLSEEGPFHEGFPDLYLSKDRFYDLILGDGTKIVAKLSENGNLWEAKSDSNATFEEKKVAAWRRESFVITSLDQPAYISPIAELE